ncbi:MAG: hypothetical protein RLZZ323_288 [Bacteroidota bacterium]|jgi:hypothetical protein
MKTKTLFASLFLAGTSALFAQQTPMKAGSDRDAHGCIASAGYSYSELKKECIRTFEQKIQLKEIASKGNYNAAVVFNNDQSKAEIFLKEEKRSVILKRAAKGIWKNGNYTLTQNKGLTLSQNKKPIYKS